MPASAPLPSTDRSRRSNAAGPPAVLHAPAGITRATAENDHGTGTGLPAAAREPGLCQVVQAAGAKGRNHPKCDSPLRWTAPHVYGTIPFRQLRWLGIFVPTFMERVGPVVDQTIAALAATRFIDDPVAGIRYSRATSIISSAYKRHGKILETAIREGLRDSNRHRVWQEDGFRVSTAANALVTSLVGLAGEEACRQSALPYGERARTLQIDMMAYDDADQTIRAYEVKRGNGQFDAGKIRSIKRDLMCVQVLLKSYAQTANVTPAAAEAKIIFYYGVRSIPRPWSLVRADLDEHFGFPIVQKIEQANDYFRERLHQLLEAT